MVLHNPFMWNCEYRPWRCPVCDGTRTVAPGFYSHMSTNTGANAEPCQTCLGAGVIWGWTKRVEEISAELHEVYLATARRLGWPIRPEMNVPYADLSDAGKELDRAFARWHLAALAQAERKLDEITQKFQEQRNLLNRYEMATRFHEHAEAKASSYHDEGCAFKAERDAARAEVARLQEDRQNLIDSEAWHAQALRDKETDLALGRRVQALQPKTAHELTFCDFCGCQVPHGDVVSERAVTYLCSACLSAGVLKGSRGRVTSPEGQDSGEGGKAPQKALRNQGVTK